MLFSFYLKDLQENGIQELFKGPSVCFLLQAADVEGTKKPKVHAVIQSSQVSVRHPFAKPHDTARRMRSDGV